MLDISTAVGTLSIENLVQGKQNAEDIRKALIELAIYYNGYDTFGIVNMNHTRNSNVIEFNGLGCQHFNEELINASFEHPSNNKHLQTLITLLDDNDEIDVQFADYLPENKLFTLNKGVINKSGIYQKSSCENIPFSDKNKIVYEVEDGIILDDEKAIQAITKGLKVDFPTIDNNQINAILEFIKTNDAFDGGITYLSYETFIEHIIVDPNVDNKDELSTQEIIEYLSNIQ